MVLWKAVAAFLMLLLLGKKFSGKIPSSATFFLFIFYSTYSVFVSLSAQCPSVQISQNRCHLCQYKFFF